MKTDTGTTKATPKARKTASKPRKAKSDTDIASGAGKAPKRRRKPESVDSGLPNGEGIEAGATKPGKKPSRYSLAVVSGPGIELLDISALRPWPNNARMHSESQVEMIAKSIRDGGFLDPVEVDESNVILAGHGRVMAAKLIGLPQVPCVRHSHLSQEAKRRYVLRANQSALNASWDEGLLVHELRAMLDDDLVIRDLGFDDDIIKLALEETLDMPDLGDSDGASTTALSTEEGTAPPEDFEVANQEHRELTGEDLEPVADAEKARYHQLPPEDATRAIRASEERIPVAWLMNREEHDMLEAYKVMVGAKTDRQALRHALGWEPVVQSVEGNNATTTNIKTGEASDGNRGSEEATERAGGAGDDDSQSL